MRVADFVIEFLLKNKINHTFCVTGRGSLFLNDALAKNKLMKTIFMHHEQSAAFASVAYSQITNEPSCCMVSTGCASTNALTGVLSAWQDCVPTIFISGQNSLNETTNFTKLKIRTYGQQQADIISIIKPITKYSVFINKPNIIQRELNKSIFFAQNKRKGPVWIDIPLDIQNMRVEEKSVVYNFNNKKNVLKNKTINNLIKDINISKRPVSLIGNGIKLNNALGEFKKFTEKFQIPVVYTTSAVDAYGSKNKLSIGSIGAQGCSRSGAFCVQNSDLIIVFGSRLNSLTTGPDFNKFGRNAKIIVIDIEKNEHEKKGVKIDKLIETNIKSILSELNKYKIKKIRKKWIEKCKHWKRLFSKYSVNEFDINPKGKIDLMELSNIFSKITKKNSVLICDSGFIDVILPSNIKFGENQYCVHPSSQGSMGYALPAIMGVNQIQNIKNIIAVIGDGSLMMNIQELQTIFQHKVNCKIFIINNNVYSIIRRRQNDLFRGRTIGTDTSNGVSCPDFKKIAKAFKIKYSVIKNNFKLEEKINSVLNTNGPYICELYSREDQDYIEIGYARSNKNKFLRRPIEDQKPFIKRSIFNKEMLIEPIDQ